MSKVPYTKEQEAAIGARGHVIVSASAGSGKTFVMIERLVSLILGGADVRRVLAVTFTDKAAAQMHEKLRAALIRSIAETEDGPLRTRLKEQLAALPLADVCTIHSFCSRIVRTHFFLADTDAAFRIVNSGDKEGKQLLTRALDEALDDAYEEGGEPFARLLSAFFRKKDDSLREMVLSALDALRGSLDYRERLAGMGRSGMFADAVRFLEEDVKERLALFSETAAACRAAFAADDPRGIPLCECILRDAALLASSPDLFAMAETARRLKGTLSYPSKPSEKKNSTEETRRFIRRIGAASTAMKALIAELAAVGPREEEEACCARAAELAAALGALALRCDDIYTRLKRERGVLDYNDLEHRAVRVLSDAEALQAVRDKYDYVFVDEYQDVNPAQEEILSRIGGKDVFLVGDRKQSIYSFRGSKSRYFTQKTQEYAPALPLSKNFRSAPAILDAVNLVFSAIMTRETCGFEYLPDSRLCGGERYGMRTGEVLIHPVPKEKQKKGSEPARLHGVYSVMEGAFAQKKADAETEAVVRIIEEEISSGVFFDPDAEKERKVTFGDIAVLVRKSTSSAKALIAALSERGIPVTASASTDVRTFWEVRLLLDWLSFLDNAEQDIPLASAMLSSIGGFCEEDLAAVRLRFPSCYTFRDACRQYADPRKMADGLADRLRGFFARVAAYRAEAQVCTASEVMGMLLADGLEAEIASRRDGAARLRRVRFLVGQAEGSVHEFLARLGSDPVECPESDGEDAVKVITMHRSKGLEYPVVILPYLGEAFGGKKNKEFIFSETFGIALKSYDEATKVVRGTLARKAAEAENAREEVRDELDLLYVAMTRAQYRLHLVYEPKPPALCVQRAECYTDFFDFSLLGRAETALPPGQLPPPREAIAGDPSSEDVSAILRAYGQPYRYAASVSVPVKSSATQLVGAAAREGVRGGSDGAAATAEEGTAYHAFLQYVTFGASAREELARMQRENILPEEQLALLDADRLEAILNIPCLRGLEACEVWREQKFLVRLRWDALIPDGAAEETVFQGAIDLLVRDGDGYRIVDYKFSSHTDEELRARYAPQIALYRKAAARILNVEEGTIRASIVNIRLCREIAL